MTKPILLVLFLVFLLLHLYAIGKYVTLLVKPRFVVELEYSGKEAVNSYYVTFPLDCSANL